MYTYKRKERRSEEPGKTRFLIICVNKNGNLFLPLPRTSHSDFLYYSMYIYITCILLQVHPVATCKHNLPIVRDEFLVKKKHFITSFHYTSITCKTVGIFSRLYYTIRF